MTTTEHRVTQEKALAARDSARRVILNEVEYAIETDAPFDVTRSRNAVKRNLAVEVSSDRPNGAQVARYGYMLEALDEVEQMMSEGTI